MAVLACIALCGPFAAPGSTGGYSAAPHQPAQLALIPDAMVGGGHGGSRMLSALPAAEVPGNSTTHAAALEVVKGEAQ